MGLYYLVFPIYSLIITFCSSGINVALATEVAKCRRSRFRYNEQKLLRIALIISFLLSLLFTIIVILFSSGLSEMQGNINARLGYIAIAPAIILSSMIATLRGYFQGVENMVPTTVSLIIEQIAKLSCGLILAQKLCIYGISYAVLGAIIGVTISEVVALIIISINFFNFKGQLYYNYKNKYYNAVHKVLVKKECKEVQKQCNKCNLSCQKLVCNNRKNRYTVWGAAKKILKVFIPTTLSSIVLPIATMIDSFLIINILVSSGYSSVVSTSLYGLWGGVVQSLISIPIIIISGIATSIVPSLSGVVVEENINKVNRRVSFFLKLTLVLSILMFTLFYVFAEDILRFLYGGGLDSTVIDELKYATIMLKISSVSIIYYALLQTMTSILQALGKSYLPLFAMVISLVVRIVMTVYLVSIPNINIYGAIIANVVFLSLVTIILALCLRRLVPFNFKLFAELGSLICAGLVIFIVMGATRLGLGLILNYFATMVISAILGVVIFSVWVYCSKIFTRKEKDDYLKFTIKFRKGKDKSTKKELKNP